MPPHLPAPSPADQRLPCEEGHAEPTSLRRTGTRPAEPRESSAAVSCVWCRHQQPQGNATKTTDTTDAGQKGGLSADRSLGRWARSRGRTHRHGPGGGHAARLEVSEHVTHTPAQATATRPVCARERHVCTQTCTQSLGTPHPTALCSGLCSDGTSLPDLQLKLLTLTLFCSGSRGLKGPPAPKCCRPRGWGSGDRLALG